MLYVAGLVLVVTFLMIFGAVVLLNLADWFISWLESYGINR